MSSRTPEKTERNLEIVRAVCVDGRDMRDVGAEHGISHERVRKIVWRAARLGYYVPTKKLRRIHRLVVGEPIWKALARRGGVATGHWVPTDTAWQKVVEGRHAKALRDRREVNEHMKGPGRDEQIRKLRAQGVRVVDIAKTYGMDRQRVYQIINSEGGSNA